MIQEFYWKDVEQTFGVFQPQFTIIKGSTQSWKLYDIMSTCIIWLLMINLILENIIDFNVISIPNIDIIVDKKNYFNKITSYKQIKIKKLIMHFKMH